MVMLTTCPACRTRFRMTQEQLDAHGGDVRCGRCAKVFNAHAYLEREPEALEPEEGSSVPAGAAAEEARLLAEEAPPVEELPAPQPAIPLPEEEVPATAMPEAEPARPLEVGPAAQPEPAAVEAATPIGEVQAPEKRGKRLFPTRKAEPPKKRGFFWLWLVGSLLLLVSLGVQGLYFFRSELAARHPEFKPLLLQLCGVLQCSIRLPANPDLLSIEASNLEAEPDQVDLVTLNAILRNRARLAQEYPLLELTLTDTQDRMIARRIFAPKEYAKNADLSRGMQPNEEVTVKLYLDLDDLKATGYRVFLFYPE